MPAGSVRRAPGCARCGGESGRGAQRPSPSRGGPEPPTTNHRVGPLPARFTSRRLTTKLMDVYRVTNHWASRSALTAPARATAQVV
jgi:hypothetical protein